VTVNDPWGYGNSLEWATSSPPPLRNIDSMPRIRSERPAFDAKFPHLAVDTSSAARKRLAASVSHGHGGSSASDAVRARDDQDNTES
jgi:cytochrome c oxidase subunit 1